MNVAHVPILAVAGLVAIALVATASVALVSWVAAWLARISWALAAPADRFRSPARSAAPRVESTAGAGPVGTFGLDAGAHNLLARQAWWRLRC